MMHSVRYLLTIFVVFGAVAHAQEDPEKVIEQKFWGKLYENGGKTFYCQKSFKSNSPLLAASPVYSDAWMRDFLQCGTKRQCLRESEDYRKMLSDLHNIVPADSYFDFKRQNTQFGTLDESVEANECGIRKKFQVLEPPKRIKGDIARIMLYMHQQYNLPLMMTSLEIKRWHELDPADKEEKARNERVKEIQGNSNPFIDDPKLAESF